MGPIGCPETSVRNYHYSLRINPEEHSSHLLRGGILKLRIVSYDCDYTFAMILVYFVRVVVIISFYTFGLSDICILFLKVVTWLAENCRSSFCIKIIVVYFCDTIIVYIR
jgi:hypothetical protein